MKKSIFIFLFFIINLNYLQAKQEIIAVVPSNFPPQYKITKDGKLDGFAIDVLNAVVSKTDYKIKYVIKDNWKDVNKFIIDNKAHVVPNIGITEQRKSYLLFTQAVESFNVGVYSKDTNSNLTDYMQLNGKKLGVVDYNIGVRLSKQFDKSKVKRYDSKEEMFYALLSSEIDFCIYPIAVFDMMIKRSELENTIIQIGKPIKEIKRAIAVNKNYPEVYEALNKELASFINTKEYLDIYTKWYGQKERIWSDDDIAKLLFVATLFLIVFMFLYKYILTSQLNKRLKKEIDEKVQKIREKDQVMVAQSRHAAMGEMISMIAHQWRQPLSIISMSANNILADIDFDMVDKKSLKDISKEILLQTNELSNTIDDFSNFFKPSNRTENVMVHDIFDTTFDVIKKSLDNNDIDIIYNCNSDKEINTYVRELMQVLINIIKNAKEILVEKNIENKTIEIDIQEFKESIQIQVCDNAGGINFEEKDRIFEPYFSTKSEKNGTGLGLYMSKVIIENHLNGKIKVENKNGGACFIIKLPYHLKSGVK